MSKKFTHLKNLSSWRRLSIATWRAPNDPTVYGNFEFDCSKALEFLQTLNQVSPEKITMTHLVAKAFALTLAQFPDLNGIIRFSRIYLRKTVDIFLQVAIEALNENEKPDLSGAVVSECDKKSLVQIAQELKAKAIAIRKKEDPHFQSSQRLMRWIPAPLLALVLKMITFLIYDLGISFPRLGLPPDPFGSAMITNVGMFHVPAGFAPLVPMSRVPLIVCMGEIKDKPWVDDGQVVVRPILDLKITLDHRFIDGLTGARMAHYFEEILENPEKLK